MLAGERGLGDDRLARHHAPVRRALLARAERDTVSLLQLAQRHLRPVGGARGGARLREVRCGAQGCADALHCRVLDELRRAKERDEQRRVAILAHAERAERGDEHEQLHLHRYAAAHPGRVEDSECDGCESEQCARDERQPRALVVQQAKPAAKGAEREQQPQSSDEGVLARVGDRGAAAAVLGVGTAARAEGEYRAELRTIERCSDLFGRQAAHGRAVLDVHHLGDHVHVDRVSPGQAAQRTQQLLDEPHLRVAADAAHAQRSAHHLVGYRARRVGARSALRGPAARGDGCRARRTAHAQDLARGRGNAASQGLRLLRRYHS
mmetsp:Transcript_28646/g.65733  ORF Transcript_28646/g.65733 Transcript_28646/m.65733 type:complete len:323 (+) Transcript_28646:1686-2654(+)